MAELKNVESQLALFRRRVWVAGVGVLVAFGLIAARLVYLQVVRHEDFREQAESNRTAVLPSVPDRGRILDRNGVVLASNYSAYTIEVTPSKVPDLDATLQALGEVIELHPRDIRRFKRLMEESKRFDAVLLRSRLSDAEIARFVGQRYRFPGVDVQALLFRHRYLLSPETRPESLETPVLRAKLEALLDGLRSAASPLLARFGFADPTGAFLGLAQVWLSESRVEARNGAWFAAGEWARFDTRSIVGRKRRAVRRMARTMESMRTRCQPSASCSSTMPTRRPAAQPRSPRWPRPSPWPAWATTTCGRTCSWVHAPSCRR